MDTQDEPRRTVPPRPPPVASGIKDPDDSGKCPYCFKEMKREQLVLHVYIEHEM